MHPVRLFYFDGTGRAELSRLILAHGAIEYQDVRLAADEWDEMKPGES